MVTALDKNTALVLIDLQNGIVNFPVAHPIKDVINNSVKLAEAFRNADLPVVLVNVNPADSPLNNTRKDAEFHAMDFPAEWFEIIPELNATEHDIRITKNTWNAFTNKALHETLHEKGITGIVLAGVATSIGVEGTARAASEHGYNITFASDAMTDMVESAHNHSIDIIFPRLGEVGTTEAIIAKLEA
jgi:nicotinamidase-related amidase